jgi:hypothetical protein
VLQMRKRNQASLGFCAHSGWAVMVVVSNGSVILRRRIEMTVGTGHRARQPYHAAEEMELPKAQAFLESTRETAVGMASTAIREGVETLLEQGYTADRAAVLVGSSKPLPELARILAAHPLIHTAEGVFYREVLMRASEDCSLPVVAIPERDAIERCAAALHLTTDTLQSRLIAMGKAVGPPWTRDEKLATAAALTLQSTARFSSTTHRRASSPRRSS